MTANCLLSNVGLPMKLTFFVTPLEGLRKGLSQESLAEGLWASFTKNLSLLFSLGDIDFGVSAKVQVERSAQLYRLPIDPNLFKLVLVTNQLL